MNISFIVFPLPSKDEGRKGRKGREGRREREGRGREGKGGEGRGREGRDRRARGEGRGMGGHKLTILARHLLEAY